MPVLRRASDMRFFDIKGTLLSACVFGVGLWLLLNSFPHPDVHYMRVIFGFAMTGIGAFGILYTCRINLDPTGD